MSDDPILKVVLTVPERLAILETKLNNMADQHDKMLQKIDALLEFKHKGLGALSFVTAIIGSSIIGAVYTLSQWLKPHS